MSCRKVHASFITRLFLFGACLALLLTAGNYKPGLTQSSEAQRKLNTRTFNKMPLMVKEVRNLQKEEHWFRDLEIEVENISEKPIYYVSLIIEFPEIEAPPSQTRADGSTPSRSATGFWLTFGAPRLGDVSRVATPDDISIPPGETYVFRIPEGWVKGFEHMKRERNLPPHATAKMDLEFDIISFGDGTGYIAGEKRVYPKKEPL